MPTVAEVCENFGLTDVDLEYSDADYQNLTTYKLFQQTYRQRMQGANPKVGSKIALNSIYNISKNPIVEIGKMMGNMRFHSSPKMITSQK